MEDTDETTDGLYNTAAELAKQFEKVIGKMKQRDRTAAAAHATVSASGTPGGKAPTSAVGRQQQQQKQQLQQQLQELLAQYLQQQQQQQQPQSQDMQQQKEEMQNRKQEAQHRRQEQEAQQQQQRQRQFEPQLVTTNASNHLAGCGQRVYTEPSELRLILKLESWIAENGSLVVRPSVREDRACQSSSAPGNAAASVAVVQCSGDNSDEDEEEGFVVPMTSGTVECHGSGRPLQQQQQQHQASQLQPPRMVHSGALQRRPRGQSEVGGKQQLGAIHSGARRLVGGGGGAGIGPVAGPKQSAVSSVGRRRRDFLQSGGDGCQVNNHHDGVSDGGSSFDDSVGVSSDSEEEHLAVRGHAEGSAVAAGLCADADPSVIQQLLEMLQKPDCIAQGSAGR